jgi:hypothetical protein
MNVIHSLEQKMEQCGNCLDYSKIQDPATLPPPTTFRGIFTKGIMEYEGIEYDDWYGYSFNGKRIARIRWDNTEKSLRLWLKNILQQEKHAQEIAALPAAIKSKLKPRAAARKPCPCGECYKNERNEKVFEYTYDGNKYDMCEQRSFVFKNLDIDFIPICLRLLELEYGLVMV